MKANVPKALFSISLRCPTSDDRRDRDSLKYAISGERLKSLHLSILTVVMLWLNYCNDYLVLQVQFLT